jgi:hypothetical protein
MEDIMVQINNHHVLENLIDPGGSWSGDAVCLGHCALFSYAFYLFLERCLLKALVCWNNNLNCNKSEKQEKGTISRGKKEGGKHIDEHICSWEVSATDCIGQEESDVNRNCFPYATNHFMIACYMTSCESFMLYDSYM